MKKRFVGGAIVVLTIVGAAVFTTASPAQALGVSKCVALVPDAGGEAINGGSMPSNGGFPNPPFTTQPVFVDVSIASIETGATNPLTDPNAACGGQPFDTVALIEVCTIGTHLANATFKSRITDFAQNGGKLLIWDSECTSTDYSQFVFPFTTNNPGAGGATGTLTIQENNDLGSNNTADSSYVDASVIGPGTDAIGDANVFLSNNSNWCVSMVGQNSLGVNGGVVNYAKIGTGLIVYSGLDIDFMDSTDNTYTPPTNPDPTVQLDRIWMNQLALANTTSLKCSVKAAASLVLTPKTQTQVAGQNANLTAHVTSNGVPLSSTQVTLKVTSGPGAGKTVSATTNSNGDATFAYTVATSGTDQVEASITVGSFTLSDTASVTWTALVTTTTPAVTVTPRFTG